MAKDWEAVAAAINARVSELDLTQRELAEKSGVSPATLRQLQNNYGPRRRSPRLLAAVSEALGWPTNHLARVLDGGATDASDVRSLRTDVDALRRELEELQHRVTSLESTRQEDHR